jgi:hypothetical protein
MQRQLALLDNPPAWRLDERTREVGRRGVASARAALAAAIKAESSEAPDTKRSAA